MAGSDAKGASLPEGVVRDVREGSAAWRAGLAPDMHVMAVNGQEFSADALEYALKRAERSPAPITLIVRQNEWYQTLTLDYHGGVRYPHLERVAGTSDMLAAMQPHTQNLPERSRCARTESVAECRRCPKCDILDFS